MTNLETSFAAVEANATCPVYQDESGEGQEENVCRGLNDYHES